VALSLLSLGVCVPLIMMGLKAQRTIALGFQRMTPMEALDRSRLPQGSKVSVRGKPARILETDIEVVFSLAGEQRLIVSSPTMDLFAAHGRAGHNADAIQADRKIESEWNGTLLDVNEGRSGGLRIGDSDNALTTDAMSAVGRFIREREDDDRPARPGEEGLRIIDLDNGLGGSHLEKWVAIVLTPFFGLSGMLLLWIVFVRPKRRSAVG
jgi:hypothetical protein